MCCINLDVYAIYVYLIPGKLGLAVDQQGHVCISEDELNEIQRLSPDGTFCDIVLSEHDDVDKPMSITFNNDFTKLFIINRGKTVFSVDCSEHVLNIPCTLDPWSGLELFGQTIWWISLLFLSAELEMDDVDDEMKLEESVVTVAIVAAST